MYRKVKLTIYMFYGIHYVDSIWQLVVRSSILFAKSYHAAANLILLKDIQCIFNVVSIDIKRSCFGMVNFCFLANIYQAEQHQYLWLDQIYHTLINFSRTFCSLLPILDAIILSIVHTGEALG